MTRIHPTTTLTHPETARFRPNALLDRSARFSHFCSQRPRDVILVNSRLQNVYITHSEYGDKGPPLFSAQNSLSQTLPRPSCPCTTCTTLLPEVERTISRNLPFMTHVLTPNPEISIKWTHPDLQTRRLWSNLELRRQSASDPLFTPFFTPTPWR